MVIHNILSTKSPVVNMQLIDWRLALCQPVQPLFRPGWMTRLRVGGSFRVAMLCAKRSWGAETSAFHREVH
jgi:hypothetical protein